MKGDIAEILKDMRIQKGWTQAQLAEAASIPQANISRYENGAVEPTISTFYRLVEAMGFCVKVVACGS